MVKAKVREILPIRRTTPTKTPTGKNWSDHKPDLKIDFNSCCAYCGSFDGYKHTYFEVDHFVPKSLFEVKGKISYCQYDNLTYSCKFCNNNKGKLWPSKDENVPNIGDEGFVDSCLKEYDDHLYRTDRGNIMWSTPLGKWMATVAFKFDERERSIIILWNLRRLFQVIKALELIRNSYAPNSDAYNQIDSRMGKYALEYVKFDGELMEFYDQ